MSARIAAVLGASLLAAPLQGQVTTHPRDMALSAPASARPDPSQHRVLLGGGLNAYVVEDRSAPLVTLTAFIGAGYADGVKGAAELVAHGLRSRGSARMAEGVFQRALRSMTAEYSVSLGPEAIEITLDVPSEDAEMAAALLGRLIVEGPLLRQGDLELLRERAGPAMPSDGAGAESGPVLYEGSLAAAAEAFRHHVLGGTSYGHQPTADELGSLSVDDGRDFVRRFFGSGNVVVAAGGDFTKSRLVGWLRTGFADIRAAPRYSAQNGRPTVASPTQASGRRVFTYPADKLQGWLVIGHELPIVPVEDRAALEVMNYILGGGHFDTRLFRATRDIRGLTNDESGFPEWSAHGPGTYAFHTYGRPEAIRLLLHLTLEEIERIRSGSVTEEELFVAKGALAEGVFADGYRGGWATARTLAAEWVEDPDHRLSATYEDRIRAVTAGDVREAARKYLHPDRMQAVLIGPIEAIEAAPAMEDEGALSDYGEVVRGR